MTDMNSLDFQFMSDVAGYNSLVNGQGRHRPPRGHACDSIFKVANTAIHLDFLNADVSATYQLNVNKRRPGCVFGTMDVEELG